MLGPRRRTYHMKDDFNSEEEPGMGEFQREVLESSFLKIPRFCFFGLFFNGETHTTYRNSKLNSYKTEVSWRQHADIVLFYKPKRITLKPFKNIPVKKGSSNA